MTKETKHSITDEVFTQVRKSEENTTRFLSTIQEQITTHNIKHESDLIKVHDKMVELSEDVKEIVTQTQKTNGRVTGLESWRQFMLGGLAVLTALCVPVLIAVVINFIKQ